MSLQREASSNQQLFDALADPTRRSIIELLAANGQMAATEIYNRFPLTNPAVSQHLKVLRLAELVRIEKDAQRHIYRINTSKMRDLEGWIKRTTDQWSERFDQLDTALEAEKKQSRKRR